MKLELRPAVEGGVVDELARALEIHSVTAQVLASRGHVEPRSALRFLDPRLADLRSPEGLAGLAEAVSALEVAIRERQIIGLFGDYDVDGVSAAAVMGDYLRKLGVPSVVRVASREGGYGFREAEGAALYEAGAKVAISLDCGTSDIGTIEWLRARDVKVVVVDHHQVPSDDSPAAALLNPHRKDSAPGFRSLCSAGLAFYLAAALRTRLGRDLAPDVRELTDLVALGTIADVMPLVDENRILVAHGLRTLAQGSRPGLRALSELSDLRGTLTARDVAFRLAPRLNAPGRLGEARPALDCLLAVDAAEALARAGFCDQQNRRRQELQQQIEIEAFALAEKDDGAFLLLASDGWHPGVVGIVAQRVVERFRRPAAVIAIEGATGRGSARSVRGLNLYALLASVREHFVRFGGHAAACGFSVETSTMPALREAISAKMAEAPRMDALEPEVLCDTEVAPSALRLELAEELARMQPFGAGNTEPLLLVRGLEVRERRSVGKGHLRLMVSAGDIALPAIGFGMGDDPVTSGSRIDAAVFLDVNEWRGARRAQLRLHAISAS